MTSLKTGKPVIDFIKLCYKASRSPLLIGAHGIGKSELLEQAASSLGLNFISRDLSLMEPADLVGMPKISGKTTKFLPPDFLPISGSGIIVLEELNRCERYVRAPCLQLLTNRTLNDYKLPPGWLPVAAINPTGEDYEVFDLDPALLSRFAIANIVADSTGWIEWAKHNSIHQSVINYIEDDVTVFEGPESNPRSWKYVSDLIHTYESDEFSAKTLRVAICGTVGPMRANAFLKSLKKIDKPLRAIEVLNDYSRHRESLKRWVQEGKLDVVTSTLLAIQKHLQAKSGYESVKDDQTKWRHLNNFIRDLPPDLKIEMKKFFEQHKYQFPTTKKRRKVAK
jgi:hypothetical protein